MSDETGGPSRRMPTWAIAALAIAVVVMVLGIGSALFPAGGAASAPAHGGDATLPAGAQGFAEGGAPATAKEPVETQWGVWGAPTFRLGFSFVIAYLAAYAVRVVLKTAMLGAGMAILLLVGLQAAGIIEIHWAVLETKGGTAAAWLKEQTESLHAFLTGYLPSAAAATTGLIAGIRGKGV